ncbi:PREDICTED: glucoside xylosyltransferase 2 [Nicrophorus vespilloides]|uniref:UDP-D-xylose:beta-D-glucoside alpha-1,3-D-xylosyltransferase n=1 Tax=Nicrophorus vespilloides TaxID=110193 RepID=A0ABM1MDI8_NICVS|nr:PREDICTED: glucoside xylosyltransferase 2 [Nicrophorus vespilloides]
MRLFSYTRLCIILTVLITIFYLYWSVFNFESNESVQIGTGRPVLLPTKKKLVNSHIVTVAVVACGDRLHETLTMIKSAIMLSQVHLRFIVVTEDNLIENFQEKLSEWQEFTNNAFTFRVMPLTFPKDNAQEWRKLFKPCAAQRLFLPSVLDDIDSILYMDTDTLFLTPVEDVWEHFNNMNSSQMAALAPEHEDPNVGWYNRFARHPYYGPLGVNSGVMLMNLTRMREFQWVNYVIPIYKRYKLKITWGDQDIINIIFHFHPDKLYIYPCRYNFRPDHCMYMSVCKSAERAGVAVIHGSRGFFHLEKQPVFTAIYRAFEEFQLGGDIYQDFYEPLENYLDLTTETSCGHIIGIYLKNLRRYIDIKEDNAR